MNNKRTAINPFVTAAQIAAIEKKAATARAEEERRAKIDKLPELDVLFGVGTTTGFLLEEKKFPPLTEAIERLAAKKVPSRRTSPRASPKKRFYVAPEAFAIASGIISEVIDASTALAPSAHPKETPSQYSIVESFSGIEAALSQPIPPPRGSPLSRGSPSRGSLASDGLY
jgi:hypothetical protein